MFKSFTPIADVFFSPITHKCKPPSPEPAILLEVNHTIGGHLGKQAALLPAAPLTEPMSQEQDNFSQPPINKYDPKTNPKKNSPRTHAIHPPTVNPDKATRHDTSPDDTNTHKTLKHHYRHQS